MRPRAWLPRCRRALRRAAGARALTAALLLAAALLLHRVLPRHAAPAPAASGSAAGRERAAACVAWRATRCGSVLADRVPTEDLPCYATIRPRDKHISGFCECAGQRVPSIAVARACGETALVWHWRRAAMRSFTCAEACARSAAAASLALEPPACAAGYADAALPGPRVEAPPPLAPADVAALRALWCSIDSAFQAAGGLDVVLPPGQRGLGASPSNDFAAAGARMPPADVARATAQWRAFLANAPAHPGEAVFAGRGVVIGGGGLRYMVPAWVALHALRRANCTLPVEIWLPAHEAPPAGSGIEDALRLLGATLRTTDDILPHASSVVFSRYAFKAAALLFSRFEEALWLDADNVALRDPEAAIFDSDAFRTSAAGMLLWRDHWAPSAAPDAARVLQLDANVPIMPPWTCESGQLAMHKRRAWEVALLALFMNLQAPLYYRLLSSYLGAGDKETWPAAAAALRRPAAWVAAPPGAAGVAWPPGGDAARPTAVRSNAMLQHAPEGVGGELLFVHNNYFKWTLADIASDGSSEDEPPRRWRIMTPPGWDAESAAQAEAAGARTAWLPAPAALRDTEAAAWRALRALRCAPWFDAYAAERRTRHGEVMPDRIAGESAVFKGVVLSEHAGGRFKPRG